MKIKFSLFAQALLLAVCVSSCQTKNEVPADPLNDIIANAASQMTLQTNIIEESGKILNPKTLNKDGSIHYIEIDEWTSGFFPGSVWLLNDLTNDSKWLPLAKKYTEALDSVKHLKWHHDVGFMIGCSYLNGYRQEPNDYYKEVIIEAAKSLSTRFRPNAGVIQSWDADKGWQAERGWACPVIIDNMMNLELLFEASILSGDSTFANIAISHADKTIENQYRDDFSHFHVVDYDPETGEVRKKQTAQGFADDSMWARGQAWSIYGYTVVYRYTQDPKYLDMAEKTLERYLTHPNMPTDLVPYWDFDADNIPNAPRDASAAAAVASALYELDGYAAGKGYKDLADKMVTSLASADYTAKLGENGNFILMHSVGSIPHNSEIDVPLNYADYYYLEALLRKQNIEANQNENIQVK